jgi:hypothetical protein
MGKIKLFLTKYPDRILLAAGIITLLIVLIKTQLMSSPEDQLISNISAQELRVKTIIKQNQPLPVQEINQYRLLLDKIKTLVSPQLLNNWLMYRKPIYKVKVRKDDVITLPTNFQPLLSDAQVKNEQPDRVVLTWQKNEKSTARIKEYRIYRKGPSDKKFVPLAKLAIETITPTDLTSLIYEDTTITPESTITYYITAFTDETKVLNNKTESDPSNSITIITPGILKISVTPAITTEMAMIRVEKYLENKWRNHVFNVKKGNKIGGLVKKTEGEFDFSTGYSLKDIQETEETKTIGNQKLLVKRWRIIYSNDKSGKIFERMVEKGEKGQDVSLVPVVPDEK